MNEKPDENQYQLHEYRRVKRTGETFTCGVCGFESPDKASVENCHLDTRLERERAAAITDTQHGHVGFALPPQLAVTARTVIEDIRAATEHVSPDAVLPAATAVLREHFPAPSEPTAFQFLTHLTWLQQYQALPGYPVRTTATDRPTIREYCNTTTDINGTVTPEQIRESPHLEWNRIYRAKVLEVTDAFFTASPLADAGVVNATSANASWGAFRNPENTLFAAGTAHNTVVRDARNWLATHPAIEWTVAPHTIGIPRDTTGETQPADASAEQTAAETAIYDFAGFTDDETLAVIGSVVEDPTTLSTELDHIGNTTAQALIVVRSRKAIHEIITYWDAEGWLDSPAAPIDDTLDYYKRRPNIHAVNEEFTTQVPSLEYVQFVTAKQLVDDVITPVDVFPTEFMEDGVTE